MRVDLHKLRQHGIPVLQNLLRARAARGVIMSLDPVTQQLLIVRVKDLFQIYRSLVAAERGELAGFIQHISNAAGHTGRKIAPHFAQHNHQAVRHVLAAVIAQPFHHRARAGVANGEPLAAHAVKKRLAAGGTIQHHVANENILFRDEGGSLRRIHDDAPA